MANRRNFCFEDRVNNLNMLKISIHLRYYDPTPLPALPIFIYVDFDHVDPCETDNGGCEGHCVQKKNGRDCICDEGKTLVNETLCQGKTNYITIGLTE